MIFFGTNARQIAATGVHDVCEHCNSQQQSVCVYQGYFHIFWIPVFPLRKKAYLVCSYCKRTLTQKECSGSQARAVQKVRDQVKTPVYTFTGLLLLLLFFGYGFYDLRQEEKLTASYLAKPAINDLALFEESPRRFRVLKIVSFDGDAIVFRAGNYIYESIVPGKEAIREQLTKSAGYFTEDLFQVPVSKYGELKVRFIGRE